MKRVYATGFFVIAIVFFLIGIAALMFSFGALAGILRLIYVGLGALLFICCIAELLFFLYHKKTLRSSSGEVSAEELVGKKARLWTIGIALVCVAIYLGDFVINGSHPFSELGAAVSLLLFSTVIIVLVVRGK